MISKHISIKFDISCHGKVAADNQNIAITDTTDSVQELYIFLVLTNLAQGLHISVKELRLIVLDNDSSPVWHQVII